MMRFFNLPAENAVKVGLLAQAPQGDGGNRIYEGTGELYDGLSCWNCDKEMIDMTKETTQEEHLDYLVEEFKADSDEYRDLQAPADTEGKRRVLRSLMNIRMPRSMSEDVLKVQDDYLKERISENGIVTLADIPVTKDNLSIWQGDITRLKVDAIVNAANSQMLGCFVPMHTCIDNCIHTFAGVQLRAECNRKMRAGIELLRHTPTS